MLPDQCTSTALSQEALNSPCHAEVWLNVGALIIRMGFWGLLIIIIELRALILITAERAVKGLSCGAGEALVCQGGCEFEDKNSTPEPSRT